MESIPSKKTSDLPKKAEAILFSAGRYVSTEEIARLCKKDEKETILALRELQALIEQRNDTSLVLINEGNLWKLTIREDYGPLVRSIVTETELTKSQMETLAVIAFKYPIKQSELIRIRTNKAYDHLMDLEKSGFILRQKFGRSRLIKLTDKFFEYFDLPREKLKERFKGFEQIADTIRKKEDSAEELKKKQREMAEEAKKQIEVERKIQQGEIDLVDEDGQKHELMVYEEPAETPSAEPKATEKADPVKDEDKAIRPLPEPKTDDESDNEEKTEEEKK